ncbi:hypothetical protein M413DRAFT_18215 [Hebeloma cylindrosporum]|uniref:WD40 repeat-like protein n=1 Tax=Hebeloma cylindrosporum TaxID=76867 RepID=A0A0C3C266_HEBCY|nr:hypothetical protein M413DRAFT_18215 [Hebeloma cylindrosporum h7]
MPKDLPGFYWDEERNRYFPLSSRTKQAPPPAETIRSHHAKGARGFFDALSENAQKHRPRRSIPWRANEMRFSTESYTQRMRNSHGVLCANYASTSRATRVRIPTMGSIHAFCSTQVDGHAWRFIGDDCGWLYSHRDSGPERSLMDHSWSPDLNLQHTSQISSISVSGAYCVSTCLGPGKISVQNLASPERLFVLNLVGVFDIRSSSLRDKELVLGARKAAVYIPDVESSSTPQYLRTNSDVFSVIQQEHLVYTGTRNGSIERFDMRMPTHRSQKLLDDRFKGAPRSSALHLSVVRDRELLISHLNGDLMTFDLRYPSSASPLRVFDGHVNTYTQNLGIAVDHERDLLFAAGQDCRLRGWSLRTGLPLSPPTAPDPPDPLHFNPFLASFSYPITSLQVTEETGEAGVSLWATADHDLDQIHLGQR